MNSMQFYLYRPEKRAGPPAGERTKSSYNNFDACALK